MPWYTPWGRSEESPSTPPPAGSPGFPPSRSLDVDYDILTRTGLQCAPKAHEHLGTSPRGTVRFSIGPFNTGAHTLAAIKAVGEIAAQRN